MTPIWPIKSRKTHTEHQPAIKLWSIKHQKVSCMRCSHACHTYTNPRGRLKWPSASTRLTTFFTYGLMSDLVISKQRKRVWSNMTLCALTEDRHHLTVQTLPVCGSNLITYTYPNYLISQCHYITLANFLWQTCSIKRLNCSINLIRANGNVMSLYVGGEVFLAFFKGHLISLIALMSI